MCRPVSLSTIDAKALVRYDEHTTDHHLGDSAVSRESRTYFGFIIPRIVYGVSLIYFLRAVVRSEKVQKESLFGLDRVIIDVSNN